MDPSGPSQPPASASYTTADNPVTSTPAEQQEHAAHQHHHHHQGKTEDRLPPNLSSEPQPNISEATPSSLGYGIRGSDHDTTTAVAGSELDGEQMRAPGEGAVADAVRRKPGAGGAEPDMAGGLER
ncbi:hypothetical protein F4775DRAFT_597563 [Biscogniauxia sp. FL1348]|nr:hypothetical protein F4775DRAFT_597563 [Biscogniauxia sp. FL1348]